MQRYSAIIFGLAVIATAVDVRGAGERLYGVHWWDYSYPTAGAGPQNGWSVETIVTESAAWWRAPWFVPLYQQVTTNYNASIVTRIDYDWGQTVPAPSSSTPAAWAARVVEEVVNPLGAYARRWIIGNEPNIVGEGNGWASNQITPAGYAAIYQAVRSAVKSQRPQDEVLFAPVSPGGVIPGVRWKDGNEWLAEAIDATLVLPGAGIDGFAIHAYGNPFASAAQAVSEFRASYVSQLGVIDSRGLQSTPVYLTEWNRATSTSGDLATNEQVSADFLRQSLVDVNNWNRMPGNHNIRSLAWFVNEGHGGWQEYSLEWWKSQGNPVGHAGDLWTALMESNGLAAGLVGTRPVTDYNIDGQVSSLDWNEWRTRFGQIRTPTVDGNRNGEVDAADYVLWRKNLAPAGSGAVANVPELPLSSATPAAWLVATAIAVGSRRRV